MDSLDAAIIDVLREDGRIANVALAERVGLTPGPCLRRVQRLEADRVIVGYQAQISPAAANQSFEVLLDIEITDFDMGSIESFEAMMAGYPQVLELHRLFGSPDYLARVAVADLAAYEQFLTSKVLAIPGIHRVSSRFPMKTIKSLRPL
ncbi:Lrp/AsnC family transcriptional regulator [Mycobacterium sp. CBMA293]|uniref:Lrp/AsnC family transcriptional regulator n=1 Tax=unclassified Mycolicibacterium TaxID=2636767 RepID=UPI0012DC8A04|nr:MULTISPECIES: Lrp/AsnC family transcriptional regulator [unclassified Mycolicibacterium]MUL45836.1 Lrp/AsnC family transcriptional regulator [Mycolicibacterium sp. CBMA 360]MUL60508.1 Lrp/AsnC family transcriptional regulator [Mycolicibacterium sp. CBMA 335]MUL72323.1 Lrp/AsnC family transcriptional regulator [Mycolicibacterium sp. CBMA 311]MUL95276.1 Lrp/AsnC family transcriptional regulator [Mycolicibacterium sp. CBMA 230]MUM06904.1 ArsR family transcriptional regulator [Mycolicibacterium